MPRNEQQNCRIRSKRRKTILEKSLVLLSFFSYDDITVDDIAKAANCSHGLFYHYFSSKEDVYRSLLQEQKDKYALFVDFMSHLAALGGTAGLRAMCQKIEEKLSCENADLNLARLPLISHVSLTNFTGDLQSNLFVSTLTALIKEGQNEGAVRTESAEKLAEMFIDYCYGAIQRKVLSGSASYQVPSAEEMMLFFLKD